MHTKNKKENEERKTKQGKKDSRNQNAEEGKMYCVYMMKCSLFSCGLFFFFCVDFLLLFLLFVNISVEKQRPLLEPPHPSAILLMNWHTPKHLGLLFMHWPPFLPLYNFSADACTIHTVYNILKLVILALRPNLMLLQQP